MDFDEASRILNMELLGLTPETFDDPPGHVINQAKAAFRVVRNTDSDMVMVEWDHDEDGIFETLEYPDVHDETTDTRRDYEITIAFDAPTELEAQLAISAVTAFVKRRMLSLQHPVFTARIDN